jgi:hypothetical protein
MATSKFGTDRISGLDSQTAQHLLDDTQLQRAENVNWDLYGAVKPEAIDLQVFSVATPQGVGVVYVDDAQVRISKAATNNLYLDEVVLSTTWGVADPIRVVQGRGEAIIYDGTNSRVWDGDLLRKLGTLVGTGTYDNDEQDPLIYNNAGIEITTITHSGHIDSNGVISIVDHVVTIRTATAHGMSAGDKVYLTVYYNTSPYPLMEELDSQQWTITAVTSETFSFHYPDATFVISGLTSGTYYTGVFGATGTYKYRVSYTITLPNDKVIESSPTQLMGISNDGTTAVGTSSDVSATDQIKVRMDGIKTTDVTGYVLEDGTKSIGTDYTVGIRLWRTKTDDTTDSYYLLHEFTHAESYNKPDGLSYIDQIADVELGALWTDGLDGAADSHDDPPTAEIVFPFAGRLYVVDGTDPSKVFPSMVDNYNYYGDAWYFPRDTHIIAIGTLDDRALFVGQGRAWVHTNSNGLGAWDDIVLPAYPANQEAIVETPYGLLLATSSGLYHWDGTGCIMLSAAIKDDWSAASVGEWHGAFIGDEAVFANASYTGNKAFSLKMSGVSTATERNITMSAWRVIGGHYDRIVADPFDGVLIAQMTTGFWELYGGATDRTVTIQTKEYGGFRSGQTEKIALDLASGASYAVTMSTGLGYTDTITIANTSSGRRMVYGNFAQLQGEYWSLTMVGTGTIYGWIAGMTQSNARF